MDRFPYDAEAREDQVCQLIDARTKAIRADILLGRQSTVDAVLERLEGYECSDEEAAALVKAHTVGGSAAVGPRIAAAVEFAIFEVAEQLAEADVADMERARAASADEYRVDQAELARALH